MALLTKNERIRLRRLVSQPGNLKHRILDPDFPKQNDFVLDWSTLLAANCTRRAGKSWGIGQKLFIKADENPSASCLYLALTRASAKNIMWNTVIKPLNDRFQLGGKPNEADLILKLPNEAQIMLAGADQSYQEMEKYLGGKYPLVVIDESGSFKQDLFTMVYENLMPAVADYGGQVCLIGSCTRFLNTLFHHISTGQKGGWGVHKWTHADNPHMRAKMESLIAEILRGDPKAAEKPFFRRMYLNEWVLDQSDLVYSYDHKRNWMEELPKLPGGEEWDRIGGLDLGWEDPTAFIIGNFNADVSRRLYFTRPFKASHMTLTDVEKKLMWYQKNFNPSKWIVDNANKQAVEELKKRTGLPLEAAEKQGKTDFIEIMNGEYLSGHIQLIGEDSEAYAKEMMSLIWDKVEPGETSTRKVGTGSDKKEHPRYDNHLCDAGLYVWRHCYNYLFSPEYREIRTEEDDVNEFWEEQATAAEQGSGGFDPFAEVTAEDPLGLGGDGDSGFFGDDY